MSEKNDLLDRIKNASDVRFRSRHSRLLDEAADRIRSLEGTGKRQRDLEARLTGEISDNEVEIASLRARLAEAEKDAERYRFLRSNRNDAWEITVWIDEDAQEVIFMPERLDEAVDAALASGRVKEGDR